MKVRRSGGMTEYVPSPAEKRDAVIRDHVLELLENLHVRLERLEQGLFVSEVERTEFGAILERIRREEAEVRQLREDDRREAAG